jgi:hypothetical protein
MGLSSYLGAIDPDRARSHDLDPFMSDRVGLVTLASGQRVEVTNRLVPVAGGDGGSYREPGISALVPVGVPRLRPC